MIWTLTNGLRGHETIVRGVAACLTKSLATEVVCKRCVAPAPWSWVAPYGPAPYCKNNPELVPPWPKILLACGRTALPIARHLRKISGCFTVAMQNPKLSTSAFDLVWAPIHDQLSGPNVISTLTAPHELTPTILEKEAKIFARDFIDLPRPFIAVMIGGPNAVYDFGYEDGLRLAKDLEALVLAGAGLALTLSRRTPDVLIKLLEQRLAPAIAKKQALIWRNEACNPYRAMLGLANGIVVTGDSINMIGEACLPAVPVHVFYPSGGSRKFDRFYHEMTIEGYIKKLNIDILIADMNAPAKQVKRKSLNSTEYVSATILDAFQQQHSQGTKI